MHDLVPCRDRVVTFCGIRHVRRASFRRRYQSIAGQQASARYGHRRVRQGCAIIRLAVVSCRDRDRHRCIRHRQLAVFCRYRVVAGSSLRELIALEFVRYRALARQRDASGHYCSDRIVTHKAFHVILRPALRCASICERFVLRRDRHGLRVDRQRTRRISDRIIPRKPRYSSLILFRTLTYISDRRSCPNGVLNSCHITGKGTRNGIFADQR